MEFTMDALIYANGLTGSGITAGQILKIPSRA